MRKKNLVQCHKIQTQPGFVSIMTQNPGIQQMKGQRQLEKLFSQSQNQHCSQNLKIQIPNLRPKILFKK